MVTDGIYSLFIITDQNGKTSLLLKNVSDYVTLLMSGVMQGSRMYTINDAGNRIERTEGLNEKLGYG